MQFSITIPSLPPKEFSPNWRGHWAVRGKAANAAYDEVIALVAEQGWNNIPFGCSAHHGFVGSEGPYQTGYR